MKNLRLLIWAVVLTVGLGLVTPVLPQSGCTDPGQTSTPPCASAQLTADDSTITGQIEATPASTTFDLISNVGEAVVTFLLF